MNPSFRLRPYFDVASALSVEELTNLFRATFQDYTDITAKVRKGHISLHPSQDLRYWSPHLIINFYEDEGKTQIHGLYGPKPSIWMLFMFFYVALSLLVCFITIIGFANRQIGEASSILYIVPVILLMILTLYAISYIGQKKAHYQVYLLHDAVQKALGQEIPFQ